MSSFSSPHYIFSVSCGIRGQWSIAAWFVVLLVLEGFSLTGGHHFVHLSVQKGPLGALGPGRLCQCCGRTGAMGGPAAHWVSGQANRFYLRFTHHAKPLLAWYSHVHCSEDYAPSIFCRSLFFLFHFVSLSLPPHFLCFSFVFHPLCFGYISFTPLPLPLFLPPSISLSPPFGVCILNLASMPVSALALPLREASGHAEEPLFSRPFLWMKRWNKGMKALGKVWKLPIHQCKEILRWQLADGQPSTTRDSRVGLQHSAQQTDRARPDQTPHSSLF